MRTPAHRPASTLPPRRAPGRAATLALALASALLTGCDAGHREDPGSDNRLGAPTVTVTSPYEGQVVVRKSQGAMVEAKVDLTGALGRNEGATLRYRVDQAGKPGVWFPVVDVNQAISLGALPATQGTEAYVLVVEVLDKSGKPFTASETVGEGVAATTRVLNPSATCRRTFKLADGWQ